MRKKIGGVSVRALSSFSEQDFEFFRNGVVSGRLNPVSMGQALFIFPLLSFLYVGVVSFTVFDKSVNTPYKDWIPIFIIQWVAIIIFGLLSILFFFKKISLKFQKIQMLTLVLSVFQMTYCLALASFVKTRIDFMHFPFTNAMIIYTIGSLFIFGLSLLRAYRLLQKGEFKEGGRGLAGKQYSERINNFPSLFVIVFAVTILGGLLGSFIGNLGEDLLLIAAMLLMSLIMYTVGLTEFIFVFYCKLRFPSFNITAEQQVRMDRKNKILFKQINRLEKEKKEAMKQQNHEKRKSSKNLRG